MRYDVHSPADPVCAVTAFEVCEARSLKLEAWSLELGLLSHVTRIEMLNMQPRVEMAGKNAWNPFPAAFEIDESPQAPSEHC
jgi:hypothetical protein